MTYTAPATATRPALICEAPDNTAAGARERRLRTMAAAARRGITLPDLTALPNSPAARLAVTALEGALDAADLTEHYAPAHAADAAVPITAAVAAVQDHAAHYAAVLSRRTTVRGYVA